MNVKIREYPYRYTAFSLNIQSAIPVDAFTVTSDNQPDVLIGEGIVPECLMAPLFRGAFFETADTEFLLRVPNIARYYVQNGNKITVERTNGATWRDVSVFLPTSVFGALLHQRGILPLHASGVAYKGKTLLFSGQSGSGKSTIAAAFVGRGASLIADDIATIHFSTGNPLVKPGIQTLKIWEDSLLRLRKEGEDLIPVREGMKKFYLPADSLEAGQRAIDHIIVLQHHNLDSFQVKAMSGSEKFNILKANTYFYRSIKNTSMIGHHFNLCSQLASRTPVTRIIRPNTGFRVNELIDLIMETVAATALSPGEHPRYQNP